MKMKNIKIFISNRLKNLVTFKAFGYIFSKNRPQLDLQSYKDQLDSSNTLIIVAHPDDETIFAGSELINNKCFVLCLTNKSNKIRNNDFNSIMNLTNNFGIMLNYPDLTKNGYINNWNFEMKSLYSDIYKIISYKQWNKIITHNKNGEYNHIHHKKTSLIVYKASKKIHCLDRLYCFSWKPDIPEHKEKESLLEIYRKNQPNAISFLYKTALHENLIKYTDFKNQKSIELIK